MRATFTDLAEDVGFDVLRFAYSSKDQLISSSESYVSSSSPNRTKTGT